MNDPRQEKTLTRQLHFSLGLHQAGGRLHRVLGGSSRLHLKQTWKIKSRVNRVHGRRVSFITRQRQYP